MKNAHIAINIIKAVKAAKITAGLNLRIRRSYTCTQRLRGQSPAERFVQKAAALSQFPEDTDWQRLFLARATRRVRLDATISLDGTLWESTRAPAWKAGSTALRTASSGRW